MIELIQCFMWFIIIPIILGMIPTHFIKSETNNIIYSLVIGYFILFAILQIISIPMIFAFLTLDTLMYTICAVIGGLCIISIIINFKYIKEYLKNNIENVKKLPLSTIVAIVLIGIQAFALFRYAHIDDDDAFYVATATAAVETNTLYRYTALEGYEELNLPTRYVLSPFPMYTALMSRLTSIHPAILAHTIFPMVFIPLAYCVYTLIANKLFKKDKNSINLFLIILSIISIWGNYSIRSNFSFLLMRIWQGKSILANIMLPSIILMFYNCISEDKNNIWNWIVLIITMTACCLFSEMGLAFAPMILGVISLVLAIRDKKISYLIKSGICCIPCIGYLIVYLFII